MTTPLATTNDTSRLYEVAILLPASLTDKEKQQTLKGIDELFAERSITVQQKAEWKRMGLAYSIKGNTEGQYLFFYVEGNPEVMQELDRVLTIEKGVLRHLVLRLPEGYALTDWTAHFAEWKESLEKAQEEQAKQREEALKKKIVKRAVKKAAAPVAPVSEKVVAGEEIEEEELEEKIGEIISDEDLNL